MTRPLLSLLGASFLGACTVALPEAPSCPTAVPVVTARIEPGEVLRRDLGMAEMREEAVRLLEPGGLVRPALRRYVGQSLTKTRLDARLTTSESVLPDGSVCAVPQRIDVVLRFVRRELRVASEARGDACLEREVETHEQRHVALDDAMIADFRPVLEQRVGELGRNLAPALALDAEAAKAELSRRLRAEVRQIYDGFEAMRLRRHRAEIDTPAEYARVTTICEGRVNGLTARRR